MDFLQASIDAALKNGDYENLDDNFFEGQSYHGSPLEDPYNDNESPENTDSLNEDEEPPILDSESGFNDSALSTISQVLTAVNNNGNSSPLPASARAYQEDVIPLDKCKFNGNRLLIEGCKYEFVRLNVRANVYFRCVVCYGIYQRRRAVVTKSGVQVDVPSVGSLKLVSSTGEIRGNPDQPSGIPHCCEVEKYRENIDDEMKRESRKEAAIKKDSNAAAAAASAIDPLSFINQVVSNNNNIQSPNISFNNNAGIDDEEVVPLEKCKFNDKRLEIEGCKYVFSRTQSGPRDYYRCTACIALYHKRHFRKLPTPKIGSLSLVRETGVLTGNPEMPRGLPHICDNFDLHCAPIRTDNSAVKPKYRPPPPALAGIYEAAQQKWSNSTPTSLSSSRPTQNVSITSPLLRSPLISNANGGLQKRQNDLDPPLAKYRKLIETVMGPAPTPSTKLNYNPSSSSTSAASPPSLVISNIKTGMDFLQASIDAALKNGDYENLDDNFFEGQSYHGSPLEDPYNDNESPENTDSLNEDEEPPILDSESGFNDSALSTISQVLTAVNNNGNSSPLPASARAYQEDVIPLDKCKFNGNRLLIEGCKYEFVRLNVRANVYFRCVVCYGIYQRRRAVVTKSGVQVDVPSVGSLKLVSSTGEIRGNPDQPSGIPHCCEVEKYRENIDDEMKRESRKEAAIKKDSNAAAAAASAIDPLSFINQVVSNNNNIQSPNISFNNNAGIDDEEVVPLEKCKFNDKRLEIEGCKYVFSRTQSGPRDYYRCTACIALYHKRHFRKLPTPKIGSLSLVRETGVLTGNPEMPRGLPHICDNFDLHCAPIRTDNSAVKPKYRPPPPALAGIYEAAQQKWSNSTPTSLSSSRPTQNVSITSPLLRSPLISNANGGLQKRQNDLDPPLAKYRKLIETVMGPAPTPSTKLNYNPSSSSTSAASPPSLKHGSTGNGKLEDEESEYTYPHTNDLQTPPIKSLPDFDLAFVQRKELLSLCFQSFPKLPNQARVLIFADTILKYFNPKNLNPSTSFIRCEFPLTPTHLVFDLFRKAKEERDCFSKTKHVFFTLGYDVIRCMDVESLSRRINVVQNEFFQMRDFFDNNYDREIMLTFVTVPEMGVLADELRSFNHGMKTLIAGKNRKDMVVCDWAADHQTSTLQNVEDRIHVLMNKMSQMCGLELLDED